MRLVGSLRILFFRHTKKHFRKAEVFFLSSLRLKKADYFFAAFLAGAAFFAGAAFLAGAFFAGAFFATAFLGAAFFAVAIA